MKNDGSDGRNLKYLDYCPESSYMPEKKKQRVKIAFNNLDPYYFNVYDGVMQEPSIWWSLHHSKMHTRIPLDWEILKIFFVNYEIEPDWIDCNYDWGVIDVETGKWTGATGKEVSTSLSCYLDTYSISIKTPFTFLNLV